ncbi:VWA domain-containing protein [Stappia sp. ES.058]|uniref:VWA domain-containing protein n=1 Tax=Stappia sp. ES.058 TaxID=1881061 RepID=UPI00087D5A7E|nr:VWA domain-containing protein [Stappia sp. ES.058]SDT96550.1 protoporphyrin IX magnesium-chelatase [Stappia sp. ES.058]
MPDAACTAAGTAALPGPANARWADALLAARVLTVGGAALGGIHVRARCGPVLDRWLAALKLMQSPGSPVQRVAATVTADALDGGLDLSETLSQGRPVHTTGVLSRAHGGLLVLAMAERTEATVAGILAGALDTGRSGPGQPARLALVALDEGADAEEGLPLAIADRLCLRLPLEDLSLGDTADADPVNTCPPSAADWRKVVLSDALLEALVAAADATATRSMRRALALTRVTRIVAALDGSPRAEASHAATALRLVFGLAPQAQDTDEAETEHTEPQPDPQANTSDRHVEPPAAESGENADDTPDAGGEPEIDPADLQDMLIAVLAAQKLDPSLLAIGADALKTGGGAGKSGAEQHGSARGRTIGVTSRPSTAGLRPNVAATLRAAAPWQHLRRRAHEATGDGTTRPIHVASSDFRYLRRRHRTETTAIFAVDASGSTAFDRLGEAKGAIELLLADCYVRRDQIALIAFRGREAELLLEPTRSLVRAKRSLTGLPGGGPTPLADGMRRSLELAVQIRRKGQTPLIVLFTDGRGNIALDGSADRAIAQDEAARLARQGAMLGFKTLVIDIGRRSRDGARTLAETMKADYRALPRADAASVSSLVSTYMRGD